VRTGIAADAPGGFMEVARQGPAAAMTWALSLRPTALLLVVALAREG